GGSSCCARTMLPAPTPTTVIAPRSAPVTSFLMPLSLKKRLSAFGTFITVAGLAQGCGARSGRSVSGGEGAAPAAHGSGAAGAFHGAGPLRVLIDGEPQALAPDADVWGARIARLISDPVLACAPGAPPVATLAAEAT